MTVHTFGVLNGAGIRVVSKQPGRPINPGILGFTILAGIFRQGPVGVLHRNTAGEAEYSRIYGGLTRDSQAPICASHFYRSGEGAGELSCLRLTDGTEVKAASKLYDRNASKSLTWHAPAARVAQVVATVTDAGAGRSGGRARYQSGTAAAAVTTSTVEITLSGGASWLADEWAGAALTFPGLGVSGESYTVVSHTAGDVPVVTIEGQLSAAVVDAGSTSWVAALENVHEVTGRFEGISVEIDDGAADPASLTTVLGFRDNGLVAAWENLDFYSSGRRFLPTSIADDASNFLIGWGDEYTGSPADKLTRPANFAEIPTIGGLNPVSPNILTLQTWRWQRVSGGGLAYVRGIAHGTTPKAATIVITFGAATTATVVATLDDGGEVISDLPGLTLGTTWESGSPYLPDLTLRAGTVAMAATNTITVHYRPLPLDLKSRVGRLYVAAAPSEGDHAKWYPIASNTVDTITLASSVDLTTDVDAPTVPLYVSSTAGPYTHTTSRTIKYTLPGATEVTLTHSLSGSTTATATATALQVLEDASAGSTALRRVVFGVSAADKLTVAAVNDAGALAVLTIGNGTANADVGFTADDVETGGDGTIVRLQYRQELRGGYDGIAGLTAELVAEALGTGPDDPLADLPAQNTGLMRCAVPGWDDAVVNQAGVRWAAATNSQFYPDHDPAIVTEAAALAAHKAWALDPDLMGFQGRAFFPAYGKIANPYGVGLYTASLLGALLGREARGAAAAHGFHLAAAGEGYGVGDLFRDLTTGAKALNNEALNGYGLTEIRRRGVSIYPWGDRIPLGDGTSLFAHMQATKAHIGRVLLTNTQGFNWLPLNAITFIQIRGKLTELFTPWWRDGWFDDSNGANFADQITFKCDATNNTATTKAAGEANAEIAFDVVGTSEKVILTIGPSGVSTT